MVTVLMCQAHPELVNPGHGILRDTLHTRTQLEWDKSSVNEVQKQCHIKNIQSVCVWEAEGLNLENWNSTSKQSRSYHVFLYASSTCYSFFQYSTYYMVIFLYTPIFFSDYSVSNLSFHSCI